MHIYDNLILIYSHNAFIWRFNCEKIPIGSNSIKKIVNWTFLLQIVMVAMETDHFHTKSYSFGNAIMHIWKVEIISFKMVYDRNCPLWWYQNLKFHGLANALNRAITDIFIITTYI